MGLAVLLTVLATAVVMLPAPVAPGDGGTASAATSGFVPMTPVRVLDTRTSSPLGAGSTLNVSFAGRVPAGATAVALNVTGNRPSASTFLTVWPAGSAQPPTSNVNLTRGQTRPNSVLVGLGANQSVTIYNAQGSTEVLVDLMGYFTHGFTGITPVRAMDTRSNIGAARLGQATIRTLQVRNVHGIPGSAVAVAVNVTATRPSANTFITVWPEGGRPNSSNLNVRAGVSVPNLAVVGIGADDRIRLYNDQGGVDLLVDIMGYFDASGGLVPLAPTRRLDTRQSSCGVRLGPGETRTVRLTDRTDRSAAIVNVTAVGATQSTFITVWPTGQARPNTSNLNVSNANATPNLVMVGLGEQGQIDLYNAAGTTHLLVDLFATTQGPTPTGNVSQSLAALQPQPTSGATTEFVVRPEIQRAVGCERIAVWICNVPGGTRSLNPVAIANWANAEVAPYFAAASRGRFTVQFVGAGAFNLGTDDPNACINESAARTGAPYTNAFGVTNDHGGNGLGGPGLMSTVGGTHLLAQPPNVTRRGFWVGPDSVGGQGAASTPSAAIVAHEIGHTLHWPHSFAGGAGEYDNTMDLMSGDPGWDTFDGWCQRSEGPFTTYWPCKPQHTLAFNRVSAGWVDDNQIAVHRSGSSTLLLDPPAAGGTELLVAPLPGDSRTFLTAEARPKVAGPDSHLDKEGVALHIVDQRPGACFEGSFFGNCPGILRRHRQPAPPETTQHVLGVGESRTIHGVTVTVTRRLGNSFEVTVSGTFSPPAASPFALNGAAAVETDGGGLLVRLPGRPR